MSFCEALRPGAHLLICAPGSQEYTPIFVDLDTRYSNIRQLQAGQLHLSLAPLTHLHLGGILVLFVIWAYLGIFGQILADSSMEIQSRPEIQRLAAGFPKLNC